MTSQPIRTAVAGFGLSGSVFHAPFIASNPAYELAVIATSDEARQAKARQRYPQAKIVSTPEDILSLSAELDLVVLGTPPATHFPLAKAALEAGLDVVVDKPFTVRSAEGEELIRLAAKLGRVLTVYQNRRWDGDSLTVQKLLDAGTLGTVTRFEVGMERWAPEIAKAWKASATAEDGGGVLFDLGTHVLDLILRFFGPATVTFAEITARRPQESADDDVFLALRHESGVLSHVTINLNSHLHGPRFRILGTEGGFVKFGTDPQEPYLLGGGLPTDSEYGVEPPQNNGVLERNGQRVTIATERGAYPEFYRILAEKLDDGGATSALPLPVDPADSVTVLKLIEQARALA
ncbi:Gfo/Idh/MocA family oxidoreductase [Paenarthrobacter aurescens]|uniref:Oxidoreductase n=1 Tax=Paenarthrobacter aurescens TaxID=43663 RepID=A0A4Y3NKM3_PAEAU|nr:Gfo/Idh/MocA family oxidoreductase [Paenarthrobacter aurescens]MDO6145344.1 Gfo/Idh/MocA family oxidoreductase [Paenarthrobacter aurescens]MDO6149149.1 Gfo/Idh/MocA family oxidoreductase [Paenarthrobacter aurescens]MDO6160393.1 Gfo/Idh/MocA family oxidoreductase [Paenarthrobacter aurescens]MDO6164252.1 Gfo/Idh/MocA family oxidoreductase [Paenarthrobacter aurescens]GEB19628.1 oxidoreductase [Paenarthrobacter aurescens]